MLWGLLTELGRPTHPELSSEAAEYGGVCRFELTSMVQKLWAIWVRLHLRKNSHSGLSIISKTSPPLNGSLFLLFHHLLVARHCHMRLFQRLHCTFFHRCLEYKSSQILSRRRDTDSWNSRTQRKRLVHYCYHTYTANLTLQVACTEHVTNGKRHILPNITEEARTGHNPEISYQFNL